MGNGSCQCIKRNKSEEEIIILQNKTNFNNLPPHVNEPDSDCDDCVDDINQKQLYLLSNQMKASIVSQEDKIDITSKSNLDLLSFKQLSSSVGPLKNINHINQSSQLGTKKSDQCINATKSILKGENKSQTRSQKQVTFII